MSYVAAGHTGTVVSLILNDAIIGEGIVVDTFKLPDGETKAVVTLTDYKERSLISRFNLAFDYSSGTYWSNSTSFELNNTFKDTKIVSKSSLQYGAVPDTFKNVPGYGEKRSCTSIY